ncbi:MAG: DUF4262 domain-containing protein [Actinomycetota bacterium]|nr:DUF4262 domain-containing protein [Actinomycetota bacterium]
MSDPRDPLGAQWGLMSALEKIEWMIETDGYAVEAVLADGSADPPRPSYTYTVAFPDHTGFADVAVMGLTPVASKGLLGLVADLLRGGAEIPLDVELVGLLDNDLRCRFAAIDLDVWGGLFATAAAWYRGEPFEMVQLMYPDRSGFLPYEAGYERRMRYAQPVLAPVG